RQTCALLSAGFLVCKNDRKSSAFGRTERNHQLETEIYRRRKICELAGKCKRLESFPLKILGNTAAYLEKRRLKGGKNHRIFRGALSGNRKIRRSRNDDRKSFF